jgi:hypothetical protein
MLEALSNMIQNSSKKHVDRCKRNPSRCLRQVVLEAVVVVGLFAMMTYIMDQQCPTLDQTATFLSIWIPVIFVLKLLDVENTEQFGRVAMWTVASKLFAILTAGAGP